MLRLRRKARKTAHSDDRPAHPYSLEPIRNLDNMRRNQGEGGAMPKQYQAGFTLVELMVAVAVFLILAAIAIPGFTTYLDKSRLRGAAYAVVN